jgi:hypothetical protein
LCADRLLLNQEYAAPGEQQTSMFRRDFDRWARHRYVTIAW